MNYNIIATTTNTIENAEIVKYIDLISTNVVVGTNIFSDLGASITDFFGGFSDTYQNKLDNLVHIHPLSGQNSLIQEDSKVINNQSFCSISINKTFIMIK